MIFLVPLSFLAFMALGLPDGILGVAWPSIQSDFGLPLDALGILLAAAMTGYILSSFSCGILLERMGIGALLASSTFVASLSLAGYALVPGIATLLFAGFLAGAGGGAVDSALNTYAAFRFRPRTLNLLHAGYSLGTLMGPLAMTAILGAGLSWRLGYALVATIQFALGCVFAFTRGSWNAAPAVAGAAATAPATYGKTFSQGGFWLGALAFFAYAGLEFSVGQWTYTLLMKGREMDPGRAAIWVSVYWGGFLAGRVLAGWLPAGDRVRPLLAACAGGMILGSLLVAMGGAGPWTLAGLAVLGLAFAPVFPMLIAVTPRRLGASHAANAMGFQVAAATLGQAAIPGLIGVAAQRAGFAAISHAHVIFAVIVAIFLFTLVSGKSLRARGTAEPR